MTDSSYTGAPAARMRPTVVTVSSYLLYATAALTVINAVIALSFLGTTADITREVYRGTSAEGTEGLLTAVSIGGAAFNIVVAAGLVILAIFNNRGRNPSRIVTWVVGGLAVCCGGLGLAGTALTNSMNVESAGSDVPDAAELQRRLDEALPGWYTPVTTTLSVLMVLLILGAVVLLALPAANAFFRPQAAAWQPPVPAPPYPAPPYPGQTYPGQQPGQPQPGYPGQPEQGQGHPAQPYPGQTPPGQTPPGQADPGQTPAARPASDPTADGDPPYPGRPPHQPPPGDGAPPTT